MPAKSHRSPAAASQCPSLHLRLLAHTPATRPPLSTGVFGLVVLFLKLDPIPGSGPFPQPFLPPPSSSFCPSFGSRLECRLLKERVSDHHVQSAFVYPHTHHLLLSCVAFIATRYLAYLFYSPSPDLRMSVPCEEGPRACSPLLHPRHPEHGADPAHAQRVFIASASEDSAGERSGEGTGRPWVKGQGLSASEPPSSRPRVSPCGPLRELQSPPWFLLRLIECN